MAANLFKSRYFINPDGSESSIALTNTNTVFVHTYLGDDSTGDGTREKPYRSLTKACLKSGISYILFRGVINEYISTSGRSLMGDDVNQMVLRGNYAIIGIRGFHNLSIDFLKDDYAGDNCNGSAHNVIFTSKWGVSNDKMIQLSSKYVYFKRFPSTHYQNYSYLYNSTVLDYYCYNNNEGPNKNILILKSFDILIGSPDFVLYGLNYYNFTCACVFKAGGVNIIQPLWTNDSKANVQLLRDAYIAAGVNASSINLLFKKDSFNNETCRVINELRSGGSSPNVINKYTGNLTGAITSAITAAQAKTSIQLAVSDSSLFATSGNVFIPNTAGNGFEVFTYTSTTINSATLITFNGASYTFKVAHSNGANCVVYGDVLDVTLNPNVSNEALWSSDLGGYIGKFRPSVDGIINSGASIIDVDSNGSDTVNAGDLIYVNSSDSLVFNTSSAQLWNRFRDASCVEIPLGSSFKGLNGMSQDGSPFGTYLGKKQNLIDVTVLQPGDALTVGVLYKIFNDNSNDATKAILYNGVQYLPEFTFICLAGVTIFSLLNAGSGTYVKKVSADVLESIEILPYDTANGQSAFPKFSSPLMGECKLLYYTAAGANNYNTVLYPKIVGMPVLFAHCSETNFQTDFPGCSDKISLYDAYAISNADQEFYTLANAGLTNPKSTYFTAAIPILRFLRREVNAHFDLPYDY